MNPKISVIIPVYNAENYLHRSIDSVLAQTFRDFDLILIDDGSNDGSGKICDEYQLKDGRVKVFHKPNGGVADARNWGIDRATGEYITFVDADDYVEPRALEEMYACALERQSDIVICDYYEINGDKKRQVGTGLKQEYRGEDVRQKLTTGILYGQFSAIGSLCNKLIRKKIYQDRYRFQVGYKRGEDARFVFECLLQAGVVTYLPKAFYWYYQNGGSAMHSFELNLYYDWKIRNEAVYQEARENGIKFDEHRIHSKLFWQTSGQIREMVKRGYIAEAYQILRDPYLLEKIDYLAACPPHIRVLAFLVKHGMLRMAMMLYRLWGWK